MAEEQEVSKNREFCNSHCAPFGPSSICRILAFLRKAYSSTCYEGPSVARDVEKHLDLACQLIAFVGNYLC
jgi:hypothetical protein